MPPPPKPAATPPKQPVEARVLEVTDDSLAVEVISPGDTRGLVVTITDPNDRKVKIPPHPVKIGPGKAGAVIEVSGLRPGHLYAAAVNVQGVYSPLASMTAVIAPKATPPELAAGADGTAVAKLSPAPADQATHVTGYILLVSGTEGVKDLPAAGIKNNSIKKQLEEKIKVPYYAVEEFTKDELSAPKEVPVGKGAAARDGKHATLQDPKLQKGGTYRVNLVIVLENEGSVTVGAVESATIKIE